VLDGQLVTGVVRPTVVIIRRRETSGTITGRLSPASPKSRGPARRREEAKTMLALSVGIPIVIIAILVFLVIVIFAVRRRR
jgi:hypothetical protein